MRSVRLSNEAFSALKDFLAIDVPLDSATQALEAFAASAGLSLGAALENFAARAKAIELTGLPTKTIRYDAAFGRPLDYYTGLGFEIAAESGEGRWSAAAAMIGC